MQQAICLQKKRLSILVGTRCKCLPTGQTSGQPNKVVGQNIEHISHDGKHDLETRLPNVISKINKLHKVGYAAYEQTLSLEGGGAVVVSRSTSYDFDVYYMTASNTLYWQVAASEL